MNRLLTDVFLQLKEEGYFERYHKLSLLDIPTEKELSKGNIPIPRNNEILVFAVAEFANIPVSTIFDVIFPSLNVEDYVEVKSILNYVTVNPSYEIDYLPKGYSGICLFEFPDGKPDILKKLAVYGEKKDYSIHDTLLLTQKPVLDKILNFMEHPLTL